MRPPRYYDQDFFGPTVVVLTGIHCQSAQSMSQNLPERSLQDFLSLRHPIHFVLADANNRNVIIANRFLAAPVRANRDFF